MTGPEALEEGPHDGVNLTENAAARCQEPPNFAVERPRFARRSPQR